MFKFMDAKFGPASLTFARYGKMAFNPSSLEAEQADFCEVLSRLVYMEFKDYIDARETLSLKHTCKNLT